MTELKEPTIADAMARVSLPDPASGPTFEGVSPIQETLMQNAMDDVRKREENIRLSNTTWKDKAWSIVEDNTATGIYRSLAERAAFPFQPDPNFTAEKYEELLKTMGPQLDPELWHRLEGSYSEAHMQARFQEALTFQKSRKTYQELGIAWMPAYVLGMIFDPINLAAGVSSVGAAWRISALMGGSGIANLMTQGVFGAAAGGGTELFRQSIGYERSRDQLIAATAFGAVLGTGFAPFLKNPYIRAEVGAIEQSARKTVQEAATGALKPFTVQELEHNAIQREMSLAQERAAYRGQRSEIQYTSRELAEQDLQKVYGDAWARMTTTPEGLELRSRYLNQFNDPRNFDAGATNRLRAEIDRFLNPQKTPDFKPPQVVQEILESPEAQAIRPFVDDLVQRTNQIEVPPVNVKAAAKNATEPTPPVSVQAAEFEQMRVNEPAPPNLDAALREIAPPIEKPIPGPLPTPARMAENPNYFGDFRGTDGAQYRIMRANDGSFTVSIPGQGVVARGIEDISQAKNLIPLGQERVMAKLVERRITTKGIDLIRGKYGLRQDPENPFAYIFYSKKGKIQEDVGNVFLKAHKDGRFEVDMIEIAEAHQGHGLARLAYDALEKDLGVKMTPSGILMDGGYKLWLKRNPALVQHHRKVGDFYYSPKRLIAELPLAEERVQTLSNSLKTAPKGGMREASLKLSLKYAEEDLAARKAALESIPAQAKTPEAMSAMFRLGDPSDIPPGAIKPGVREAVSEILTRMLPEGYKFELTDKPFMLDGADRLARGAYFYDARLLKLALDIDNPEAIARHEALHVLSHAGLIRPDEWQKLVARARKLKIDEKNNISKAYTPFFEAQGYDGAAIQKAIDEELVAHLVEGWFEGKRYGGFIDKVIQRSIEFFRTIRDALGIRGFRTLQDVFEDLDSGAMATRTPNWVDQLGEGVAARLERTDEWDVLDDPAFRSVNPESVPESARATIGIGPLKFRIGRFDMESVTGTSRNPLARLFSPHMVHNTVGMSDHSLAAMPAELRARRAVAQYGTEFQVTYQPAWKEWAKDHGVKMTEWFTKQDEFLEKVGMYASGREGLPDTAYHPAVKRMGDKLRKLYADQLKDMQQPGWRDGKVHDPVDGAGMIGDNAQYFPRIFDQAKVRNIINKYQKEDVVALVSKAISQAQPGMPPAYLAKIAEGYIRSIVNNALDVGDDWVKAINGKDFGRLEAVLQRHTTLTPEEIADVMNRYRTKPPESGFDRLKHRLFLDESAELQDARLKSGGTAPLAFRDLLDNNALRVFDRYTRRVQGRVALARIQVKHPETGEILINGIKSDEDFEKMLQIMRQYGTDYLRNRDPNFQKILDKDEEYMRFFYDRIIGAVDPEQSKDYAAWLRRVRKYNVTRLLGQVGVAQLGEQGEQIGTLGVKAVFQKVPGFQRIIDAAGDTRLKDQVAADIERMGVGGERLHGMTLNNLQDLGDMPHEVRPESQTWKRWLDNGLEMGQKATFELSGMGFVQQQQQRHTAAAVMSWFADNYAKRAKSGDYTASAKSRMAQLNIDPVMMDRIGAQFDNVTWKNGERTKVASLNLDSWTDLEARMHFEEAVYRYTNKIIQQQDIGSMAKWMSHPVAQTLLQFRNFPLQAWANKLQYNLHMADFNAAMALAWGIAWNAAIRGFQVSLLSLGRSDGDAYREKHLTPFALGKAGFERGGMSSILPMGIDSVLALTGQQGMFDARSSGLGQSILANPTAGLIDNLSKGLGGVVDSTMRGRELSQDEARALASALPFMNQIQFSMLLSTLISDMPLRAPKKQPLFE